MGLYLYWDEQQPHTIRADIVGQWRWSDYHTQLALFIDTMQDTIARACIIDMRHTHVIPSQNALNHLRQLLDETPAINIIIVSENTQLYQMVEVLQRAIPYARISLKLVPMLESAYALIEDQLKG